MLIKPMVMIALVHTRASGVTEHTSCTLYHSPNRIGDTYIGEPLGRYSDPHSDPRSRLGAETLSTCPYRIYAL